MVAATTTVADRSLPLRPPSLTYHHPPVPEPRPHFLSVFVSAILPLLAALFFRPPPPLWLTGAFLNDHRPRPITVLLHLDRDLASPAFSEVQLFLSQPPSSSGYRRRCGLPEPSSPTTVPDPLPSSFAQIAALLPRRFPKCNSSSPDRALLLAVAIAIAATVVTNRSLPLRPPSLTVVPLCPDRGLTSLAFPEVQLFHSQPPSSSGHCCYIRPEPSSPTTIPIPSPTSFTQPMPSLPQCFPKCNSSSPGRPLLLATTTTVANRVLPLQPPSPNHHGPPPP